MLIRTGVRWRAALRTASWAALLVVCVAVPHAGAQVYDRPLAEQDLQRVLPVLRAELAAADERAREAAAREVISAARTKAMQQAAAEIAGGRDPLDWLRARSPNVAAPSTAVYEAACSRALTAATERPAALFSFGINAPAGWLMVWQQRDPAAVPPSAQPRNSPPNGSRARSARPEALAQQTRAFYSDRHFDYQGEPAPFEWQFLAADKRVSAIVMGVNAFGRVEPCRALANGLAVVVRAEDALFAKTTSAEPPSAAGPAQRAFEAAIEKARLSDTNYLNLKLQLLAARADSEAELAGKPTGGVNAKEHDIRQQNVAFYRAHRDVLDPLLARFSADGTPR